MRLCIGECELYKPLSSFYKVKNGYTARCKPCHQKHARERAKARGYNTSHSVPSYWRNYGMTLTEYNQRLIDQNNKCKICGVESKLHIDHDHNTGRIRGLLCINCNILIGHAKESIDTLNKVIEYLKDN